MIKSRGPLILKIIKKDYHLDIEEECNMSKGGKPIYFYHKSENARKFGCIVFIYRYFLLAEKGRLEFV